jgi:hypothetical protein
VSACVCAHGDGGVCVSRHRGIGTHTCVPVGGLLCAVPMASKPAETCFFRNRAQPRLRTGETNPRKGRGLLTALTRQLSGKYPQGAEKASFFPFMSSPKDVLMLREMLLEQLCPAEARELVHAVVDIALASNIDFKGDVVTPDLLAPGPDWLSHPELRTSLAEFLHALASDHATSHVVNPAEINVLNALLGEVPVPSTAQLLQLRTSNSMLCNVLEFFRVRQQPVPPPLQAFLGCLVADVELLLDRMPEVEPFCRIPGSCNPPATGNIFYFTDHGEQGRQFPRYKARTTATVMGAANRLCEKHFIRHNNKTAGIFSFFCPHGICYGTSVLLFLPTWVVFLMTVYVGRIGMHIIPQAEGRRDPHAALFLFMEKCPDILVYDFACQLSDYCLSREPGFYRSCCFCIDKFHCTGHK